MKKVLIIQTAFIGDVILSTALVEQIRANNPQAEIHFVLRAGNEVLLKNNPHIHKVWIWDKKKKYSSLFKLIIGLRKINFDYCLNLQRFLNAGWIMAFCKAKFKACFDKNPLSFLANHKVKHLIPWIENGDIKHEVDRNSQLIPAYWPIAKTKLRPMLYFSEKAVEYEKPLVILAPKSVWATKQWPLEKWKKLASDLDRIGYLIHLIGAPADKNDCDEIEQLGDSIFNFCGKLSLYESANMMRSAHRVVANDSAALHLASSVNAPSTAIFCSTIKSFGFYGLSDDTETLEVSGLDCKPCGLHGKSECPLEHFKCGNDLEVSLVLKTIRK